jgi:hypothetical protein
MEPQHVKFGRNKNIEGNALANTWAGTAREATKSSIADARLETETARGQSAAKPSRRDETRQHPVYACGNAARFPPKGQQSPLNTKNISTKNNTPETQTAYANSLKAAEKPTKTANCVNNFTPAPKKNSGRLEKP